MTWEWVVLILGIVAEGIVLMAMGMYMASPPKPPKPTPSPIRKMVPYDSDEDV